ncbi:MAG: DUF2141 domain-containing protein [Chlorobium sp.]|nr:MAG: DUF2141 domain-containing protein [Chlorobium sp.]
MKTFLFLFTLFFLVAPVTQASEEIKIADTSLSEHKGRIIVHVKELKKVEGLLGVSIYNSKKGFPEEHELAYANRIKKITATEEDVVFENLPWGQYAVSIMHDENSNGKLDKKSFIFFAIPKEGVGVSNNPKIGKGGPKYEDSVFTLNTSELDVNIAMKYLFQ